MKAKKDNSLLWRWMTNLWTVATFLLILENFRTMGAYAHLLGPALSIYVAVLALFSAEKEFERWHFYNRKRHLGEIYVVLWTVLVFGLFFATYFTGSTYRLESEIFTAYIVVLGILAITRKSKQIFREMKETGS